MRRRIKDYMAAVSDLMGVVRNVVDVPADDVPPPDVSDRREEPPKTSQGSIETKVACSTLSDHGAELIESLTLCHQEFINMRCQDALATDGDMPSSHGDSTDHGSMVSTPDSTDTAPDSEPPSVFTRALSLRIAEEEEVVGTDT